MNNVYYIYVDQDGSGDRTAWGDTFFLNSSEATDAIYLLVPEALQKFARVGNLVKYQG